MWLAQVQVLHCIFTNLYFILHYFYKENNFFLGSGLSPWKLFLLFFIRSYLVLYMPLYPLLFSWFWWSCHSLCTPLSTIFIHRYSYKVWKNYSRNTWLYSVRKISKTRSQFGNRLFTDFIQLNLKLHACILQLSIWISTLIKK